MSSELIFLIVITHILGSIFWMGTVFLQLTKKPQAPATMRAGGFLQLQGHKNRLSMYISIASWITMFSGILLYWRRASELAPGDFFPKSSLGLMIGGLAGVASIILLLKVNTPAVKRLAIVAGKTQQIGSLSTPQHLSEIKTLEERISYSGVAVMLLLVAAVVVMALA